jgi:hypothetical protein
VAETLVRQGWRVVLPSRRYHPLAVPEARTPAPKRPWRRGASAQADGDGGRAIWVEASWDRPDELAKKAGATLAGPVDLLVAWVHDEYRTEVMRSVERLLAATATVVEVRPSGEATFDAEPALPDHPTQVVLLGTASEFDSSRLPSRAEIAEGVMVAVGRALDGHPASVRQIGLARPMVR